MLAGRSAVISCSKIPPKFSSTNRNQTELPFGGAAMISVSIPPRRDAETRPFVGRHRRAGAIICDKLPKGVHAALKAAADAVTVGRSIMGTTWLATPNDRFGDAAPQRKVKAECPQWAAFTARQVTQRVSSRCCTSARHM
jgi:hypothetical protein